MRKRFFDDRVFYDEKKNELYVARPDVKCGKQDWTFIVVGQNNHFRTVGSPKNLVEIGREPEFSMFGVQ